MSAALTPCFVLLILANCLLALFNMAWSTYYRGRDAKFLLAHNAFIGILVFVPTVLVGAAWLNYIKPAPTLWLVLLLSVLFVFHVSACMTTYKRIKYHPADVSD